jgi:hypothetical protein
LPAGARYTSWLAFAGNGVEGGYITELRRHRPGRRALLQPAGLAGEMTGYAIAVKALCRRNSSERKAGPVTVGTFEAFAESSRESQGHQTPAPWLRQRNGAILRWYCSYLSFVVTTDMTQSIGTSNGHYAPATTGPMGSQLKIVRYERGLRENNESFKLTDSIGSILSYR